MKKYLLAPALLAGSVLTPGAFAQQYTYSVIPTNQQETTITRPYAINDSGTILVQPYSAFGTSAVCLLVTGSTVKQTDQYVGSDQYFSLSNNGYMTGTGISGVYYLDDVQYNITTIPVPQSDGGYPTGINSSLLVVGMATSSASGLYAWTSKNGSFSKYVFPGSSECTLNGVNDAGDLVGTYFLDKSHSQFYAFAVIKGKPVKFSVPSCLDPTPTAISTNDIVAGTAISLSGNRNIGFVRSKTGSVVTIDYKSHAPASVTGPNGPVKLSSYYGTEVFGVNASGVLVGMFTGTYASADGKWGETLYIPFMATPK